MWAASRATPISVSGGTASTAGLGRSPGFSAFWATLSCIAASWVRPETRMGPREIWEAIQTGARNTLMIGATLGVIGIIVGTISLTGIGLKFSDIVISLAGGHLLPAVLLVALASLVLGMGVPVTAAYLITAVLAVPPLTEMGVALLAAHMIVYWFSRRRTAAASRRAAWRT